MEFESLRERGLIEGVAIFQDSMLHMKPDKIAECLKESIQKKDFQQPCVIVYGDCSSRMIDLQQQKGIARINAVNCLQMLVDRDTYRDFMKREAFVFLPEWAARWNTIFAEELGLSDSQTAKEYFRDTRREIIYLNTGLMATPVEEMQKSSEFTGLPWSVVETDLACFLSLLQEAEQRAVNSLNA